MAAQVILASIIFLMGYVLTGVVLIEIAMWVMRRLDNPAASATGRCPAVECQLASTLSVQADRGRTYPREGWMRETIEADQFGYPPVSDSLFQFSGQFQELVPHLRPKTDSELFPQPVSPDHFEDVDLVQRSATPEFECEQERKARVPPEVLVTFLTP